MTWLPCYRHEIEYRASEDDYVVKVIDNDKIIQVVFFNACNAALSFVERREGSYAPSLA